MKRVLDRDPGSLAQSSRPARVRQPALTLTVQEFSAEKDEALTVRVETAGIDRVEFFLEPHGVFELEVSSVSPPAVVRLRGLADGKARLTAVGRTGDREVLRRFADLACRGPVLQLLGFGYIPAE